MPTALTPPLKWHGGKHDLAKWIIGLMPPRCVNPNKPDPADPGWLHYVEPYFGGGAVMLAMDPEGISEVVNDLNRSLINFWAVLLCGATFDSFVRWASVTPFSQLNFERSCKDTGPDILPELVPEDGFLDASAAWRFFIHCRQSLAGRMDSFASVTRSRSRRGMNEQVSAWLGAVEGLPAVHARLKRVLILNRPALDVIRQQDGPRTLIYADPPYLHETRETTGEYKHEMTEANHRELLETLCDIEGRFLLSGYNSALYREYEGLQGWTRHEMKINNHAAGGKKKKIMTECVWINF